MCGVIGFSRSSLVDALGTAQMMCAAITHRGPDSEGIWLDAVSPVVLGHRRLSIVDLSPAGRQPMTSHCGRYVIAYNGEIYNHLHLREELSAQAQAPAWQGHSDTETLLACLTAWGLERTLSALVGMFAIALWDMEQQTLTLARDRLGEKPLYWGWAGDVLLFASELKALKVHPGFVGDIDRNSLVLLLRHSYIPAPYSIYKGIEKLMPGCYVKIPLHGSPDLSKAARPQAYWTVNNVVEDGLGRPFDGTEIEAVEALERSLKNSIAEQMLADVPLGAFLSGGVDSSSVVALMQSQSSRPVKTFTIGFREGAYDEGEDAKAVAQHLGTDHTELYVTPQDALSIIPRLSTIYCEPFADSSQIPTFLVSQMAREHVTVALSGDGGDELFGGYNRYLTAQKIWGNLQRMPNAFKHGAAAILRTLPPARWDQLFNMARPVLPKRFHISAPGEKARKLADVLALSDGYAFYRQLTSHWSDPASVVIGGVEPRTLVNDHSAWPKTDSLQHAMMAMDTQTYMSDDILVKVDRAAMASSLEVRVPMLDHRIVELAWRMPLQYKIRNGQGKWLLRQVLYKHVPKSLIERPKKGFSIPLAEWLRGPLRAWAEHLLDERLLQRDGYFNPEMIRSFWIDHLSGKRNCEHLLWNVLMFQSWLHEQ